MTAPAWARRSPTCLASSRPRPRGEAEPTTPIHLAFASPDRPTVDRFHEAALAAGGEDHGAPGLRPDYHPNYYGAFIIDPDGHNIEAVCHKDPEALGLR